MRELYRSCQFARHNLLGPDLFAKQSPFATGDKERRHQMWEKTKQGNLYSFYSIQKTLER